MNELLTRRPEPPMPPGTHEKLRQELLDAISAEAGLPRRRAVPLLAAAAVLAVIAGLAFGIPALRNNARPPASGIPEDGIGHPPSVRTLSATEQAAFLRQCEIEINKRATGTPNWYTGYQVVDGFEFTTVTDAGVTKSWMVTHSGTRGMLCGRNGAGVIRDAVMATYNDGTERSAIFARVVPLAPNTGMVLNAVARVTRQAGDGPEVDAILRGGYWFTPTPGWDVIGGPPNPGLNRILPAETIRGYDANGHLVYNSATEPLRDRACFMDPSGTTVSTNNGVKNPGPKTCRPTYYWPE